MIAETTAGTSSAPAGRELIEARGAALAAGRRAQDLTRDYALFDVEGVLPEWSRGPELPPEELRLEHELLAVIHGAPKTEAAGVVDPQTERVIASARRGLDQVGRAGGGGRRGRAVKPAGGGPRPGQEPPLRHVGLCHADGKLAMARTAATLARPTPLERSRP